MDVSLSWQLAKRVVSLGLSPITVPVSARSAGLLACVHRNGLGGSQRLSREACP
ncbi:hypothetical protein [Halomonas salipaludis]|uniref:hypothetical protein n=1 Tax=Halomonas salipaludis TaxID=2032625 RepID=UPI001595B8AA|nr:hypothetical protein [Halomonas salipaludis]